MRPGQEGGTGAAAAAESLESLGALSDADRNAGTAVYVPPRRVEESPDDMYAVGIITFEMFHGVFSTARARPGRACGLSVFHGE